MSFNINYWQTLQVSHVPFSILICKYYVAQGHIYNKCYTLWTYYGNYSTLWTYVEIFVSEFIRNLTHVLYHRIYFIQNFKWQNCCSLWKFSSFFDHFPTFHMLLKSKLFNFAPSVLKDHAYNNVKWLGNMLLCLLFVQLSVKA
jgi:hypothetical protein